MLYLSPLSGELKMLRHPMLGCMVTPDNDRGIPPGMAWAADNACFARGDSFDLGRYLGWLGRSGKDRSRCLFATAPDVVGDAELTLRRSAPVLTGGQHEQPQSLCPVLSDADGAARRHGGLLARRRPRCAEVGVMNERREYAGYLMRHLGKCVVTITIASFGMGWAATDLNRFVETGQSFVHPWTSLFLLLTFLGLWFVAMFAVWTVQANVRDLFKPAAPTSAAEDARRAG